MNTPLFADTWRESSSPNLIRVELTVIFNEAAAPSSPSVSHGETGRTSLWSLPPQGNVLMLRLLSGGVEDALAAVDLHAHI